MRPNRPTIRINKRKKYQFTEDELKDVCRQAIALEQAVIARLPLDIKTVKLRRPRKVGWNDQVVEALTQIRNSHPELAAELRAKMDEVDALRWSVVADRLWIADRAVSAVRVQKQDYEEAIGYAILGMFKGTHRFDPDRGLAYFTYVKWWAMSNIRRELRPNGLTTRDDVIHRLIRGWMYEGYTSPEELAEVMGLRLETLKNHLRSMEGTISLDEPTAKNRTLGDSVEGDPINEYTTDAHILRRHLHQVLSEREALVLANRYGLGMMDNLTLNQVGDALDLSRERVRQIEKTALTRLRLVYNVSRQRPTQTTGLTDEERVLALLKSDRRWTPLDKIERLLQLDRPSIENAVWQLRCRGLVHHNGRIGPGVRVCLHEDFEAQCAFEQESHTQESHTQQESVG